jgi:hypothetical protein
VLPFSRPYHIQRERKKLAKEAKDIYAKEAMSELAEEFRKVAELLEHQGRKH